MVHNNTYMYILILFYSANLFTKHFILIAQPGSGKGTFANYMSHKHGYIHLGLGDLYRQRKDNKLPTTSKILNKILEKRILLAVESGQKFILDNAISCPEEWQYWKSFFQNNNLEKDICCIILQASDQTCMSRMKERVICRKCFNVEKQPSKTALQNVKCSNCGNHLSVRSQDRNDKLVQQRFAYYHQKTVPIIQEICSARKYKVIKIFTEKKLADLYALYDQLSNL